MKPSERMAERAIQLPPVAEPVGSYVPARPTHGLVLTSGQLPLKNGRLTAAGKVPEDVPVDDAKRSARLAMLNAVAAAAAAAGRIDAIRGVVRVGVFVNSSPGFTDQPAVANGASDLLTEIFGDAGRHARAAVGVAELPLNATVEVELIVHT